MQINWQNTRMFKREIKSQIDSRMGLYPAIALLGPRQCGKTTLARTLGSLYFDLETDADRNKLDALWPDIVKSDTPVILDEAQVMPEIFPRLRSEIDKDRKRNGRFILLGSVSPVLMTQVSESLAGRLALLELTPFLLSELPEPTIDDLWLYGGYPDGGIINAGKYPYWQNDYVSILTQRDLPNWGLPAQPLMTQRLLKMLAALHSQCWNASEIGKSLGLNHQTVNSYLEYIQGCFMVRILEPYSGNLLKRLRKSPKVYWRDSGLLHAILQVRDMDDLFGRAWVGASWEGFVIEQILNALKTADKIFNACYLRTMDQYEVDLVLDLNGKVYAIEVKLTSMPDTSSVKKFRKAAGLINSDVAIMISRTNEPFATDDYVSTDLPGALDYLLSR